MRRLSEIPRDLPRMCMGLLLGLIVSQTLGSPVPTTNPTSPNQPAKNLALAPAPPPIHVANAPADIASPEFAAPVEVAPAQGFDPVPAMVWAPPPAPTVNPDFIKEVLKQFFGELKRRPNLVEEILKSATYEQALPIEQEYVIEPIPRWQEMPLFYPGQRQIAQPAQQQQQLQQQPPIQDVGDMKKRQGQDKTTKNAPLLAPKEPTAKLQQQQEQIQQQQQQQLSATKQIQESQQKVKDGIKAAIDTGSYSLVPAGPSSYFVYPQYLQEGVPISLPVGQTNPGTPADDQGATEFYELDNPAYYYYFYYDENEKPSEEGTAESNKATANENAPSSTPSQSEKGSNDVIKMADTVVALSPSDVNDDKGEDKEAESELKQLRSK